MFKDLLRLYLLFCRIGAFTVGGGYAMVPILEKELIIKRKWITEEDLLDYYAVGQSTPGIVAINVSTFVGYNQRGVLGAFFSTLGMITPSLIIIMLLATFINSISDYPYIQKMLKGINVAVAALMTNVIYKFAKKSIKNIWNVLFLLMSFLLVFVFKIHSVIVILATILFGLVVTFVHQRKSKLSNDTGVEQ